MPPWGSRLRSPRSSAELGGEAASPHGAKSRVAEPDILDNASGNSTLSPPLNAHNSASSSSTPSHHTGHGRSMSQPFPHIFSAKKKRPAEPHQAAGFESTDDDATSSAAKGRPSHLGKQKYSNKEPRTGNCMTCGSLVRWPQELSVFKCTICATINDLKPVLLEARHGHRTPVPERTDIHPGSRFTRSVLPISIEKTTSIVEHCVTKFLLDRLSIDNSSSSGLATSPPQSPTWNVESYDSVGQFYSRKSEEGTFEPPTTALPIRISSRRNESMELQKKFSFESNQAHSVPYSASTPGNYFRTHMEQRDRDLGTDRFKKDSSIAHSFEIEGGLINEQRKPNPAQTVFKPLEDYILASFGSFECINASFSTMRPNLAPRAASEGARASLPAPPRERQPYAETQMSELDAKTLLAGDFAENGTWWMGPFGDLKGPERARTHRSSSERDGAAIVNMKSPMIDWMALNRCYNLVIYAGNFWRRRLDYLVDSDAYASQIRHPSQSELEEIERHIIEAQFQVQQVLLRATESLLKRPGRPLSDPNHLRFLLIIFANPLLYPTREASRRIEASRSRSRSRSRDTRIPNRQESKEARKQNSHAHSPRRSKDGKSSSGQHSAIIKRLLGLMSNVSNECHHHLVSWFAKYQDNQFQKLVDLIGSFVTYRLMRQHGRKRDVDLDPTAGLIPSMPSTGRNSSAALHAALGVTGQAAKKADGKPKPVVYNDDWQIKAAARVMALLFKANNNGQLRRGEIRHSANLATENGTGLVARDRAHLHGQIIPTSDFYNTLLDYSDLIADFEAWESKRTKFAFCQYPFFLSIWAKIQIMEYDARRQMEVQAREAFFNSIMTRKSVNQYLTLRIRRDCLVEDSLKSVSEITGSGSEEIKKGIRIEFKGEEGIDAGGLRKEWFLLLVRDVFNPERGLFVYDEDSQFCYFNPHSFEDTQQFFLIGVLLGLAIYNSTILDVALPPFAFRKLLAAGPSPAPGATSHAKPSMTYTLEDLAEYKPSLAKGLRQLLEFEGDVETTFCRNFVVDVDRYDQLTQVSIGEGDGANRPVTNSNRREFVDEYVKYLLDTAVTRQFEPFKRGFFTVCGGNALSLFRPEEIELLVRGSDEPLDIASLRAVSVYENWGVPNAAENEPVVRWFWESFQAANPKQQRQLLSFITGSDRIPAMGATNLVIKLSCLGDDGTRFPVARTCFNMISLWRYSSKQKLDRMLWRAVNESEGFGLK